MAERSESDSSARRPTPVARAGRVVLVALYLAFVGLGFFWPWQPRAFWTIALPLLVLLIVVLGFHRWRSVCPLAAFGELGRRLNRGRQRKVPAGLEARHLLVPFLLLAAMLALRLVATNGDGRWLSVLLVVLALAAVATNALFTGKSWCNFLCPVGFVERVYTDPGALLKSANSQCARCTACKRSCPDIDQENSYWRGVSGAGDEGDGGRRAATYAFPGLVLAFYGYFWLRHGDWAAYFDGRWTQMPVSRELALGAGFFFAPAVPALAAALLTIALLSASSFGLFSAVEGGLGRLVPDSERRRHLVMSLAAFSAFNLFYVFAGAPTLRRITGGTRLLAFLVPVLATLVLVRRWRRSREGYVREKGAVKLLKNWPFEGPPPTDPTEAYALVQATERAREGVLDGYTRTLREILGDGIVQGTEVRMLDELRKQFGITPREHERVVAQLAEEERDQLAAGIGTEIRVQMESYQAVLAEAMLRQASPAEIEELRRAFDIEPASHQALIERVRGGSGLLLARARRRIEEAALFAFDRATLAAGERSEARELLDYLLRRESERALAGALDVLETIGDAERVRMVRPALLAGDSAVRRAALRQLADACPGAESLLPDLERLLFLPQETATSGATKDAGTVFRRLAASADGHLRAAILWAEISEADESGRLALLAAAESDPDELVRVTAQSFLARGAPLPGTPVRELRYLDRSPIERMQFLRRVPLLAELAADDLEELSAYAREESVESAPICEQGVADSGDLFVVLEGVAAVVVRARTDDPASEHEVAELGAGEIVGELSLVDGSPRSATVRPKHGPVRLLRIPGRPFRARLLRREQVAQSLLVTLTQRLRRLSGRLAAAPGSTR